MKLLKDIYLYLKYKEEINQLYNYGIKHAGDYGYGINENAGWRERLDYWKHSE